MPNTPASPTVGALIKRTRNFIAGLVALAIVLVIVVIYVTAGASSTTKALRQDGDQRACVTDLRSAQAAAQGEELDYTLLALAASYRKDSAEANRYVALGIAAAERRQAATKKLEPHNLARLCPR